MARAYTRRMKDWLRFLVVLCVSIVLPLQSVAGAAMFDCGLAPGAAHAAAMSLPGGHDHGEHDHTGDPGAPAHDHAVSTDHAGHGGQDAPIGDASIADCSQCGVCQLACTGGLAPFVAGWQPVTAAEVLVPALPAAQSDAPAHRLLRPPRPLPA